MPSDSCQWCRVDPCHKQLTNVRVASRPEFLIALLANMGGRVAEEQSRCHFDPSVPPPSSPDKFTRTGSPSPTYLSPFPPQLLDNGLKAVVTSVYL
jgi:hypothetical protein